MAGHSQEVTRWLAAARTGSVQALGEALEACRGYLLSIAQRELEPDLQAKGGASDLVQETFLKAHRHFERFNGDTEGELLRWLRRMLLNNLADFRDLYRAAEKRQVGREVSLANADSSGRSANAPAAAGLSPSGLAMAQEQTQWLHEMLNRLPEDHRQVLVLRHQDDLSFEEIGARMQRSADAARKLWARAVERLQEETEKPP
jgi:RNA polymerase sigma-70 factor, ECF subfamily